jgi:hypothetical protein
VRERVGLRERERERKKRKKREKERREVVGRVLFT